MIFHRFVFIALFLFLSTTNALFSFITYIKISATNNATGQSVEVCGNVQPIFLRNQSEEIVKLPVYKFFVPQNEKVLCKPKRPLENFHGRIILDGYPDNPDWSPTWDECELSFYNSTTNRIIKAQHLNASAMLFRHTPTYASFYAEDLDNADVKIPVYFINTEAYNKIGTLYNFDKNRSNEVELKFIQFEPLIFDGAMIVLLLLAMTGIIFGGLWSGYTHQQLYLFHMEHKQRPDSSTVAVVGESNTLGDEQQRQGNLNRDNQLKAGLSATVEPPSQPFNWCMLGFFVVLVVVFILLLYYFKDSLVWVVIVMYTIASGSALYSCFSFLMDRCCKFGTCGINLTPIAECLERKTKRDFSALKHVLEFRKILLYICCMGSSITWCIFRHHPYAFIIHTILSLFFAIFLIHSLRLPNLMWLTLLLSAMLIYDLFMVFVKFKGCSIMVEVAAGCSKQGVGPPDPNKEELPILFKIPRFNDPVLSCFNLTIDLQYPSVMLGLGDVILPGLLVGFNYAFDLGWSIKRRPYYITAVIGYFVGMIVTFVVLILSDMAQPALIYLVPCTLIPTHILALYKKQWKLMWKGHYPWVEELDPMLQQQSNAEQQSGNRSSATVVEQISNPHSANGQNIIAVEESLTESEASNESLPEKVFPK